MTHSLGTANPFALQPLYGQAWLQKGLCIQIAASQRISSSGNLAQFIIRLHPNLSKAAPGNREFRPGRQPAATPSRAVTVLSKNFPKIFRIRPPERPFPGNNAVFGEFLQPKNGN